MKINDLSVVSKVSASKHFEVSKELETINFRALHQNLMNDGDKKPNYKRWILDDGKPDKNDNTIKDQVTTFQRAMAVLLVWGQCAGLNPVSGILQKDLTKVRFSVYSWKFLHTVAVASLYTMGAILCFYKLFSTYVSIGSLAYVSFYSTSWCTSFFFIRIATKWPTLLKELSNSGLDEYVDAKIVKKCNIACIMFIGMASIEHALSLTARVARIFDCSVNPTDYVEEFVRMTSPWLFGLNVPYSLPLGIVLQYLNFAATIAWNYSDVFIVCMSLYLTSILEQINKKITLAVDMHYMPTSLWGVLREDYTRATRLVRLFDDVFSSIVLVSFASNLFFICLQLFNMLANGVKSSQALAKFCPHYPSGPLRGYEHSAYLIYSATFIFIRFLTVSLVAANVNTASLKPAPAMYRIPSTAFTKEVERFLNQVNGTMVALSGLQFFYITKELVLSVAGTIVTYELVLLQFSSEELNKN